MRAKSVTINLKRGAAKKLNELLNIRPLRATQQWRSVPVALAVLCGVFRRATSRCILPLFHLLSFLLARKSVSIFGVLSPGIAHLPSFSGLPDLQRWLSFLCTSPRSSRSGPRSSVATSRTGTARSRYVFIC